MALSPSYFQLLPYEVIQRIVNLFPPSSYDKGNKIEKVAIMHTCRSWRTTYMRTHLSTFSVDYGQDNEARLSFENADLPFDPHLYPTDQFVHTLDIYIESWASLVQGNFVKWMQSSSVFNGSNFASVLTLSIFVSSYSNSNVKAASGSAANIAAFFSLVKSLAPNANNIKLLLPGCQELFLEAGDIHLLKNAIAELACGRNLTFRDGKSVPFFPFINPVAISKLTSFAFDTEWPSPSRYAVKWALEVVRHNSETLKDIALLISDLVHLEQFLFSGVFQVSYSSLVKMTLMISDPSRMVMNSADPISSRYLRIRADHFPVLKHMKYTGPYGKAIWHLFGSENRSLEHLDATILFDFFDFNNLHPVETSPRFYGLKTIRFSTEDQHGETMSHVSEYKTVCSNILKSFARSPSAFYYISTEFIEGYDTLDFLKSNRLWANLQKLDVPDTSFSFIDALNLLTKAPMLRLFVCTLDDEPPKFHLVDLTKKPEFLKKHRKLLGPMLVEFVIKLNYDLDDRSMRNISWSTILLATLCPRLGNLNISVDVSGEHDYSDIHVDINRDTSLAGQADALSQRIKDVINDPRFDSYSIGDSS